MKKTLYPIITVCVLALLLVACHKDHPVTSATDPNTGKTFSMVGYAGGRPGIATVFVAAADKDNFNATVPSQMGALYQSKFEAQLQAYNGGAYTSNILGLNATQFTTVL